MAIRVTRLLEGQIQRAAELLARAFHDQPFGRFWEPDPERRMRVLHERFLRFVGSCYSCGEAYITADELVGVALWMPSNANGCGTGKRATRRTLRSMPTSCSARPARFFPTLAQFPVSGLC